MIPVPMKETYVFLKFVLWTKERNDPRTVAGKLKQLSLMKIQLALMGIEPMTSAILVQCNALPTEL